jgi:molybdopterin converting factor small subunit
MNITLDISAQIRSHCKIQDHRFNIESPCTIQQFIHQLIDTYGDSLQSFIFDSNKNLKPIILLSINDKQVSWQNNPTLEEGNRVSILSPIAGG